MKGQALGGAEKGSTNSNAPGVSGRPTEECPPRLRRSGSQWTNRIRRAYTVAPPLTAEAAPLSGAGRPRTTSPSMQRGGGRATLAEPLTGGGAPASAPACSLSSVNQNNDCAAGSPGARRRAVSSRGRQSGGRRSLGRAVSAPAREPGAQPLPGAVARALRRAPAPQLLPASCVLLRASGGTRGLHCPEPLGALYSHVDTYRAREIRRG